MDGGKAMVKGLTIMSFQVLDLASVANRSAMIPWILLFKEVRYQYLGFE
jgi:hypothetical protein